MACGKCEIVRGAAIATPSPVTHKIAPQKTMFPLCMRHPFSCLIHFTEGTAEFPKGISSDWDRTQEKVAPSLHRIPVQLSVFLLNYAAPVAPKSAQMKSSAVRLWPSWPPESFSPPISPLSLRPVSVPAAARCAEPISQTFASRLSLFRNRCRSPLPRPATAPLAHPGRAFQSHTKGKAAESGV